MVVILYTRARMHARENNSYAWIYCAESLLAGEIAAGRIAAYYDSGKVGPTRDRNLVIAEGSGRRRAAVWVHRVLSGLTSTGVINVHLVKGNWAGRVVAANEIYYLGVGVGRAGVQRQVNPAQRNRTNGRVCGEEGQPLVVAVTC
jgi:hypothetical protein